MKLRYGISQLLAMREHGSIDIGRFSIHAIENNLLHRYKSRSTTAVSDETPQHPIRQPRNAPKSNSAQADSGFAQFLKEHTSPRHHRVTAAGRIVPMDDSLPIPEFKPLSKKADNEDLKKTDSSVGTVKSKNTASSSGSTTRSLSDNSGTSGSSSNAPAMAQEASKEPSRTRSGADTTATAEPGQVPMVAAPMYCPQPWPIIPGGYSLLQMGFGAQEPFQYQPTIAFPSYSADHIGWFPNAVPAFLAAQQFSQGIMPPVTEAANRVRLSSGVPSASSPFAAGGQFPIPGMTNSAPALSIPTGPYPSATPGFFSDVATTQQSLQDVTKEYESLSSQLANLDRYMAIHTFELDPATKEQLVEQRKILVRELDAARRYKEHLQSSLRFTPPAVEQMSILKQNPPNETETTTAEISSGILSGSVAAVQMGDFSTMSFAYGQDGGMNWQLPLVSSMMPSLGLYSDGQYGADTSYVTPGMDSLLNLEGLSIGATSNSMAESTTDGQNWTGVKSSTLEEISRFHRRIEDAARRGEHISGLLEELTRVTEHYLSHRGVGRADPRTVAENQKSDNTQRAPDQETHAYGLETATKGVGGTSSNQKVANARPDKKPQVRPMACQKTKLEALVWDGERKGLPVSRCHRMSRVKRGGSRSREILSEVARSSGIGVWKSKLDEACSPVISRVNAHGFLPSVDGAGDMSPAESATLSSITIPLRLRTKLDPMQIRRHVRQLTEEERQVMHKYCAEGMVDRPSSFA